MSPYNHAQIGADVTAKDVLFQNSVPDFNPYASMELEPNFPTQDLFDPNVYAEWALEDPFSPNLCAE